MSQYVRYHQAHLEPEAEGQPGKKKRRYNFDKVERIILIAAVVLIATAVRYVSKRGSVDLGHGDTLRMIKQELASQIQPKQYNSSTELRLPVAEVQPDGRLEPYVILLRGPWSFGTAEIETVAVELGRPARRGAGHLVYDLEEGRVRLTLLFNAGRLDTMTVAPNPCRGTAPPCERSYEWAIRQRQILDEGLEPGPAKEAGEPCGMLEAASRGIYYAACTAPGRPQEPSVAAIYVQRATERVRNPPLYRGVSRPQATRVEAAAEDLPEDVYTRLLGHYREALQIKARVLGASHSSIRFLEFEAGRMQAEAGRAPEGREAMLAAIEAVKPKLGLAHPDVVAMQAWANN